jgi:hypothetical protein
MTTKTRKSPPTTPFCSSQERFPLTNVPQPLERTAGRWLSGKRPLQDDFCEVKPERLGPGDVIRATYYPGGLSIPGNNIHCSGGWGENTWVFQVLRIERHRGRHDGFTAACNYTRPGEQTKAGIFFLSAFESYEVLAFACELPTEQWRAEATVVTSPQLPSSTEPEWEYEEP